MERSPTRFMVARPRISPWSSSYVGGYDTERIGSMNCQATVRKFA